MSFWQIVCEFGSLHVRDRPCAFGKRPRRSKNPSSRKLPALSRFFLFPNSTNYCHGCCHELPDHDRISLTTEPVQALSIVRVAHCWKRCPRLPLPRLQDPLRPGQIRPAIRSQGGIRDFLIGTLKSECEIRKRTPTPGPMQGAGHWRSSVFAIDVGFHASFRWPGRWLRGGAGS